jgi:hypothetical protein
MIQSAFLTVFLTVSLTCSSSSRRLIESVISPKLSSANHADRHTCSEAEEAAEKAAEKAADEAGGGERGRALAGEATGGRVTGRRGKAIDESAHPRTRAAVFNTCTVIASSVLPFSCQSSRSERMITVTTLTANEWTKLAPFVGIKVPPAPTAPLPAFP